MALSLDDDLTQRRIGRAAWVAAWVGLVGGQLHALSRFATAEGRPDLESPLVRAWAEPAADLLAPLLAWGDPDLVYHHYGKLWAPVLLATLLAALVVRRRRDAGRVEAWWWRAALAGIAIATTGVAMAYWTQWTGGSGPLLTVGFAVTLPGLLLTLVGSTGLGVTLLVRRGRPVLPWALLALSFPLAVAALMVTSMGSAALAVVVAFGLLGRRVARSTYAVPTAQAVPAR